MLAELALTVAINTTGVPAMAYESGQPQPQQTVLMGRAFRSAPALGDYAITEVVLANGRAETYPLGQHYGARASLTMARIAALTYGLEAMERAGAPKRVIKGAEWGLVGHGVACMLINASGAMGHEVERPGTALIVSSVASAIAGAVLNR